MDAYYSDNADHLERDCAYSLRLQYYGLDHQTHYDVYSHEVKIGHFSCDDGGNIGSITGRSDDLLTRAITLRVAENELVKRRCRTILDAHPNLLNFVRTTSIMMVPTSESTWFTQHGYKMVSEYGDESILVKLVTYSPVMIEFSCVKRHI